VHVVERGAIVGDGEDERLGAADDGVGGYTRGGRYDVASVGVRLQLGLGCDQGDEGDVDGALDGGQDRELGGVAQLAAGG